MYKRQENTIPRHWGQRIVARAAKPDEAEELNHHVATIDSYNADGEWPETEGAPRDARGPTADGSSVRSRQRHKAKEGSLPPRRKPGRFLTMRPLMEMVEEIIFH